MSKEKRFGGLAAILFAASSCLGGCNSDNNSLIFDRPNTPIISFSEDFSKRPYIKEKAGIYHIYIEQKTRGKIESQEIYSTKREITKTGIRQGKVYFTQLTREGDERYFIMNLDGTDRQRVRN